MSTLFASVLAAGELICEFHDGYKRSLIADLLKEPRRVEQLLVYEQVNASSAEALSSRTPGRRSVVVRAPGDNVHFIERVGQTVRVTTLTRCERTKQRAGEEVCTRFSARHAWHFDTSAHLDPEGSLARQPSGAATGTCEPWKVD